MNNQKNENLNQSKETEAAKNVVSEMVGSNKKNIAIVGDVKKTSRPKGKRSGLFNQYKTNKPLIIILIIILIFILLISVLIISVVKQPKDNVVTTSQVYKEYVKSVEEKKLNKNANNEEKDIYYNSKLGLLINNGDMPKAYDYYVKEKLGEQEIKINAQYYVSLAEYFKENGSNNEAQNMYQKAIEQLNHELASTEYSDSDKQDIIMQRDYLETIRKQL
jgi:flagellar basal body-associated protein FliL